MSGGSVNTHSVSRRASQLRAVEDTPENTALRNSTPNPTVKTPVNMSMTIREVIVDDPESEGLLSREEERRNEPDCSHDQIEDETEERLQMKTNETKPTLEPIEPSPIFNDRSKLLQDSNETVKSSSQEDTPIINSSLRSLSNPLKEVSSSSLGEMELTGEGSRRSSSVLHNGSSRKMSSGKRELGFVGGFK